MNRRNFFRNTVPAVVTLPGLINGLSFSAMGSAPDSALGSLLEKAEANDHILILVRLMGGNDGLNMVVPLDMYANYYNARQNVALPQSKVLRLDGTDKTGLHPAMTEMQQLYNAGKTAIVQSVGYESQNYSHFRSTDIWMTGDDSKIKNASSRTGWVGRYLDAEYPGYPDAYPNASMPDPLAIQISNSPSMEIQGPLLSMGLSIRNPEKVYGFTNPFHDYPLDFASPNAQLRYLRIIADKTKLYSDVISAAYANGSNMAVYEDDSLAHQLKIVARLIQGGLKTKVYTVTIGGFDTHKKQVNASDTTTGHHAELLKSLSSGISAFQKDMELMGHDDRVLGMTFSEFGRRIKSNASMGTDHGAAAPLLLFGKHVQQGVLGVSPDIPADVKSAFNIPMQYDFRSVYATVLERWFCVPEAQSDSLLMEHYQSLPVIKGGPCGLSDTIDDTNKDSESLLLKMWPNPYSINGTVQFSTTGGLTMIQQINSLGQVVKVLTHQAYEPGIYNLSVYDDGLPAGIYHLRLQNKALQKVITVVRMK